MELSGGHRWDCGAFIPSSTLFQMGSDFFKLRAIGRAKAQPQYFYALKSLPFTIARRMFETAMHYICKTTKIRGGPG